MRGRWKAYLFGWSHAHDRSGRGIRSRSPASGCCSFCAGNCEPLYRHTGRAPVGVAGHERGRTAGHSQRRADIGAAQTARAAGSADTTRLRHSQNATRRAGNCCRADPAGGCRSATARHSCYCRPAIAPRGVQARADAGYVGECDRGPGPRLWPLAQAPRVNFRVRCSRAPPRPLTKRPQPLRPSLSRATSPCSTRRRMRSSARTRRRERRTSAIARSAAGRKPGSRAPRT